MAKGRVKWYSREKGYGFISQENGEDVFVHHTGLSGGSDQTLEEGDEVEFDVSQGLKGLQATNVRRIPKAA